ncbi:hypothetical protein IM40_06040 [Candidatus Paracaedimonas acanthamoebae]|nr:hypothetical protein IM40_06040 [Candidatus Paracaedimonas acanthamoebae]
MTIVSIFPAIEALLKGEVSLYGFVPPDAKPPYVIYEETGQAWSFPEVDKGTITFTLKAVSTYKGPQEMDRIVAFLKEKLEGYKVLLEPNSLGLFRFVRQDIALKDDAITREAVLEFQQLVRG